MFRLNNSRKNNFAFTLIELLVVISIISLLASIVLASLNSARKKARDARRIGDIKQIQTALELYYDDHNAYPVSSWRYSYNSSWNWLASVLRPYLSSLPKDPLNYSTPPYNGGYSYAYYANDYGCSGQWYMLVYKLEVTNLNSPGASSCSTHFNYGGTITVGNCSAGSSCR